MTVRVADATPSTRARAAEARVLGFAVTLSAFVAALLFAGLDVFVGVPEGKGRTVSAYVYSDAAWAFHTAVWLLVAATLTLVVALVRTGLRPVRSASVALFAVAAAGLVLLAVFPKTDWTVGDSPSGRLHRLGALVAFVVPPIATLRLTRGAAQWPARLARLVASLVVLMLLATVALVVAFVADGGSGWYRAFPLGTVERVVVGSLLVALGLLGRWVALTPQGSPGRTPAPRAPGG